MNFYQYPHFCNPYINFPQNHTIGIPYTDQFPYYEQNNTNSSIEQFFRTNIGKVTTVYLHFDNSQWGSKIFKGVILFAGNDYILLKDTQSEIRYVLLMKYINYATFEEVVDIDHPYRKKEEKKL